MKPRALASARVCTLVQRATTGREAGKQWVLARRVFPCALSTQGAPLCTLRKRHHVVSEWRGI